MAEAVTARNGPKEPSTIPKFPSFRTNTRRRTRSTGICVPPQIEASQLFLPVPPKLTFVTEAGSNSPSQHRPMPPKKPASHDHSIVRDNSTDDSRVHFAEGTITNFHHKSKPKSTFAAGTNQVSEPLTPKASSSRLLPDLLTKPSETHHSPILDDKPSHTSPTSQDPDTGSIHTIIDVLKEFTWINEMCDEQMNHSNILSPFSSDTSYSSEIHLRSDWDSSTDTTGASGVTTPGTDDDSPCRVPSWGLV